MVALHTALALSTVAGPVVPYGLVLRRTDERPIWRLLAGVGTLMAIVIALGTGMDPHRTLAAALAISLVPTWLLCIGALGVEINNACNGGVARHRAKLAEARRLPEPEPTWEHKSVLTDHHDTKVEVRVHRGPGFHRLVGTADPVEEEAEYNTLVAKAHEIAGTLNAHDIKTESKELVLRKEPSRHDW